MRHIAKILVVAAAASIVSLPLARAADPGDSSKSPQGHVQQHQGAVPPPSSQGSDQSSRDQSAQAPQSPAVITPPSTGDKSVITPPTTGAAKTPVITPPGTPGKKDEIQPK